MNTVNELYGNTLNSMLCVGLDPDISKIPLEFGSLSQGEQVYNFLLEVIDLVSDKCCGFKIQKAFFDCVNGGHEVLKELISYIHKNHPHLPAILDCKVGDIDNTMRAYIHNIFHLLNADGVVVNPYMGSDVFDAFCDYPEKAVVVLCKTSNPGGACFQDVVVESVYGRIPMWQHVLRHTLDNFNHTNNIVPVIGSNGVLDLQSVRSHIPETTPILYAGIGAQGGNVSGLKSLLNRGDHGVFINSSRGIIFPYERNESDWRNTIVQAATQANKTFESMR